jgi:two-component system sensor histidine kinase TctE
LMMARIEHGADALEMSSLSLRAIVHQVALEMALPAVNKNIDLSLEAHSDAIVWGQPLLLHELVANLVDNALRYTPAGGTVALRVMQQSGSVMLQVEDSGSGIAEDERERVFAPFYRAAGTLERNPGGAGLGLAIVRDIASLHRAGITLHAARGGGLLVTLAFAPESGAGLDT